MIEGKAQLILEAYQRDRQSKFWDEFFRELKDKLDGAFKDCAKVHRDEVQHYQGMVEAYEIILRLPDEIIKKQQKNLKGGH